MTLQDDPNTDIPDALPSYNSWVEPWCADIPPPGTTHTCDQYKQWGQCYADWIINPSDPNAKAMGGYCGVTCGRCKQNDPVCFDREVPGGLSGGANCATLRDRGGCYQWWMSQGNFCSATCGRCNGQGIPCVDVAPNGKFQVLFTSFSSLNSFHQLCSYGMCTNELHMCMCVHHCSCCGDIGSASAIRIRKAHTHIMM